MGIWFKFLLAAVFVITAASVFIWGDFSPAKPHRFAGLPLSLHELMRGIYYADQDSLVQSFGQIRGLIVPHHLVASQYIARGVKALGSRDFKKILILSPDHFDACPSLVCTTEGIFSTPLGEIKTSSLKTSQGALLTHDLFQREHGIYAILPFIHHYFPETKIIPAVLAQKDNWSGQKEKILKIIEENFDEKTVLLVSSDFSHYLTQDQADAKDEQTLAAIMAGDSDQIAKLDNPDQSDCPLCLWVLSEIARKNDFYDPKVLAHDNSARVLNDQNVNETTSYFTLIFQSKTK